MKYLVTGSAGFIGMHVCLKLLNLGISVIGLDNINEYYDKNLKLSRLSILNSYKNFEFYQIDLVDRKSIDNLFLQNDFSIVIHLAAQAGVRYSIVNPYAYVESNLSGFLNLLECSRRHQVKHYVYASSSSVYGLNSNLPFRESDHTDHPISLYAATKKSNELMAHSYSHLYNIPTTGLRFFTVYGPWGRPDMALFLFTKAILNNKKIDVFNNGNMVRDFTYIDDVTEAVVLVADKTAASSPAFDSKCPNPSISSAPFRIFNVGNNKPTSLLDYIRSLEQALNKQAILNFLPIQPGDVLHTAAGIDLLSDWIGYNPRVSINDGVLTFANWYREYYRI